MNCPYCNGEMRKGILYFDGRSGAHWNEGDAKKSLEDYRWIRKSYGSKEL